MLHERVELKEYLHGPMDAATRLNFEIRAEGVDLQHYR